MNMIYYYFHVGNTGSSSLGATHESAWNSTFVISAHVNFFLAFEKKFLVSLFLFLYIGVLYGSLNKQQLFPYTALTDWFYKRYLTF
jgi:hypothetical protein